MIHSNNDYRHMIHMYLVSTLIVVLESPMEIRLKWDHHSGWKKTTTVMARNHRAPRLVSLWLPLPPVVVRGWHGVIRDAWVTWTNVEDTKNLVHILYIIITFSALKTYPKPTAFRYIQHYLSMLDHLEVKWAYRESANWMLKKNLVAATSAGLFGTPVQSDVEKPQLQPSLDKLNGIIWDKWRCEYLSYNMVWPWS